MNLVDLTGMNVKNLDRQRGVLDLDQLMRICVSMSQPASQISGRCCRRVEYCCKKSYSSVEEGSASSRKETQISIICIFSQETYS